jgi:hypothetical protein
LEQASSEDLADHLEAKSFPGGTDSVLRSPYFFTDPTTPVWNSIPPMSTPPSSPSTLVTPAGFVNSTEYTLVNYASLFA